VCSELLILLENQQFATDTFWVLAALALCAIPLVFLLARPEPGKPAVAH
jgi:hypothetical protein